MTTESETLPMSALLTAPSPRLPTTIRPTPRLSAVRRISEACHERGIAAGIHCPSGDWARRHAEAGFDLVTVAADAALPREATLRELTTARGERAEAGPGSGYP